MQYLSVPHCAWLCVVLALFVLVIGFAYISSFQGRAWTWVLMNCLLTLGIVLALICSFGQARILSFMIILLFSFLLLLELVWLADSLEAETVAASRTVRYIATAALILSGALVYISLVRLSVAVSLVFLTYFLVWLMVLIQ